MVRKLRCQVIILICHRPYFCKGSTEKAQYDLPSGARLVWIVDPARHLVVGQAAEKKGTAEVHCAVMYAHSWGTDAPDYIGMMSDELLLNPWDREIFKEGRFLMHPEYIGALKEQGIQAIPDLLIGAKTFKAQKG